MFCTNKPIQPWRCVTHFINYEPHCSTLGKGHILKNEIDYREIPTNNIQGRGKASPATWLLLKRKKKGRAC